MRYKIIAIITSFLLPALLVGCVAPIQAPDATVVDVVTPTAVAEEDAPTTTTETVHRNLGRATRSG